MATESVQLLYDMYENTMGMIEELEKYETHGGYGRFAGNSHEIKSLIENQLVCLEAQLNWKPSAPKKHAKEQMRKSALLWVAAREEKEITPGPADSYAKKVVKLLTAKEMEQETGVEIDDKEVCDPGIRKMKQGKDIRNGWMRLMNVDNTDGEFLAVAHNEISHGMEKAMNTFIGLDSLKHDFIRFTRTQLQNDRRKHLNLIENAAVDTPLHLVFTGNPGTGKTTFARLVAELLFSIKKIKKKEVVEVQRSALVGGHVGETALKTKAKIDEARGGVLFVDEAYRLAGTGNDFGPEAIEELMAAMEKGDPVMIFAGYEKEMEKFCKVNPGLNSRIYKTFAFPDYSTEELAKMFYMKAKQKGYSIAGDVNVSSVSGILANSFTVEQRKSMNARLVLKLLSEANEEISNRLLPSASGPELMEIKRCDIIAACRRVQSNLGNNDTGQY